jgi:hypothetical protein
MAVCSASKEVAFARTISSSFITLAGLKKCMPSTSPGRVVAEAISSTSRVEVLEARTAPGFATRSKVPKICFLRSMFSNTASMTRSASAAASRPIRPWINPMRRSTSSFDMPPRAAVAR